MKKIILVFLLAFSSLAFGQGTIVPPQTAFKVVNGLTTPIANATITVCAGATAGVPCSPVLANALFLDAKLTEPLSNPFTSDAFGNYQFAIASGTYTVTVSASGFSGYSYQITVGGGSGGGGGGGGGSGPSLKTIPNCPIGGSVVDGPVQYSSEVINGVQTACVIATPVGSTSAIGIVNSGGGTTGNASVAYQNFQQCTFAGQTTIGDIAAPSATVSSQCDDVGPTRIPNVQSLGRITSVNTGAGTLATVDLFTGDVIGAGASGGNGTVNNGPQNAMPVYTGPGTTNQVGPDSNCLLNGGNISGCLSISTGPPGGVGAITWGTGAAPSNPATGNITTYGNSSTGLFTCLTSTGGNCLPGTGGAPIGQAFYATTNCSGLSNCVTLVDDDSTNNCGTPLTNWVSSINSYSGPGQPYVNFVMSGGGKAFLFSSCQIIATIPWVVQANATFDVGTNSSGNFINFNLGSTCSSVQTCAPFRWTGGTFLGGASLTNAIFEISPHANDARLNGMTFLNTGAGNATLGSCTNYAVLFDNPISNASLIDTKYLHTDTGTAGWCAYSNPSGAGGTNTIQYINNVIGSGTECGSVGIWEGGNYGFIFGGTIFGAALNIRLAGVGHRVHGVEMDVNSCAAHGVQAPIQWGQPGTGVNVWGIAVTDVVFQSETGATGFFQKAGDDAGSNLYNISLIGNKLIGRSAGGGSGNPLINNSPCTVNGSSSPGIQTDLCYAAGNSGMSLTPTCGSSNANWLFGNELASCTFNNQSANLSASTLWTVATTANPSFNYLAYVGCQVVLTQAATTSSTLPQCQVTWTDNKTGIAQTATITPAWASGTVGCNGSTTNTVGNSCSNMIGPITPKVGTGVSIQTINYASVGGTAMQFQAIGTAYIAY